jgi:subtilisin
VGIHGLCCFYFVAGIVADGEITRICGAGGDGIGGAGIVVGGVLLSQPVIRITATVRPQRTHGLEAQLAIFGISFIMYPQFLTEHNYITSSIMCNFQFNTYCKGGYMKPKSTAWSGWGWLVAFLILVVVASYGYDARSAEPAPTIPGGAFTPRKIVAGPVQPAPLANDGSIRIPGGSFTPRNMTSTAQMRTLSEQQGWMLGSSGIDLADAWAKGLKNKGEGAIVGFLDTGIDAAHPELAGRVVAQKDFTGQGLPDVVGHGSHAAGITAMGENGTGYVGVAPKCKVAMAKVLGDDGSGNFRWLAPAIRWLVDDVKVNVISGSLGARDNAQTPATFFPEVRDAIRYAISKGVIVIFAAGNDNDSAPYPNTNWPGRYPEVICVAASDINRKLGSFSSRGPEVDVAAPGVDIWSMIPGNRFAEWDGTSMATPVVAGVAALYVTECMNRGTRPSHEGFRKIMESSGTVTGNPARPNPGSGWGLIQARPFVEFEGRPLPPVPATWLDKRDLNATGLDKLLKSGRQDFRFDLTPATQPAPKEQEITPYPAPPGDGWKWVGDRWERPAPFAVTFPSCGASCPR